MSIHDEAERLDMKNKNPRYVIVVDQGSRSGPPIIDSEETESLIIDHHLSDVFPKDALVFNIVSAAGVSSLEFRLYLHVIIHRWQRRPCWCTKSANRYILRLSHLVGICVQ